MKGMKTKIASMVLATSVAFMASACTVQFTETEATNVTEKVAEAASETKGSVEETEKDSSSSATEAAVEYTTEQTNENETESTSTPPETASEKQAVTGDIPVQYVEVLDYLYDGIQSGEIKNTANFVDLKYDLGPGIIEIANKNDPAKELWYTLLDLDDNGTDELLIMYSYLTEIGNIDEVYELYTISDGQLVHVLSSWNGASNYIGADKSIIYDGVDYPYEYFRHEYLNGYYTVVTDYYYSTNEIDGETQVDFYVYRVTSTGDAELIGARNNETLPDFGEHYVFTDKAYMADYK